MFNLPCFYSCICLIFLYIRRYEYVFNICDKLTYTDDVCVAGSTVCDRSSTKLTTVSVYGTDDEQALRYVAYRQNETQQVLALTYSAGECYYRPGKATTARIFFFCDVAAFEPVISLNYEDYLECAVEINFATVAACGTSNLKFACSEGGACQPSATGTMTHAECKAGCKGPAPAPPSPTPPSPAPSPPVARYGCNPGIEPGLCYEAAGGEFDTKESCDANCHFIPHLYKCVAGTGCVQDAAGTYKSEAECLVTCGNSPSPPPPLAEKYKCENDKCVLEANGVDKALCESACVANPVGFLQQ